MRTIRAALLLPAFFAIVISRWTIMKAACIAALFVVFASSAAWADDVGKPGASDGPPVGISPVTIKLQTVLDDNDTANGGLQHRSVTDIESGTITAYGLTGTYRHVFVGLHSGDDYSETESLGPFTTEEGQYGGQRWRQNENGITNVLQNAVRSDDVDARSYVADNENPKNEVTLLGEVTTPVDAYVVQDSPPGSVPFWTFYDKKTGLVDRIEVGFLNDRRIITFDDYRTADGIQEAWHTHMSGDNSGNDYDSRITSDKYGVPVTSADISIPQTRQGFVTFPAGVAQVDLPSDIAIDDVGYGITFADPLVRVTINGRGLDMLLDSSNNGMSIDPAVAKQLGLATYGPYDKDDHGNWYPSRSIIGSLTIGSLQMKNVYVDLSPESRFETNGSKAVGSIGYDFLANAVVSIDYIKRTVTAYDPIQFVPPADSVPTPTNIDDGIPFVSAQIGDSIGDNFVVDTTSPATTIYPDFWEAHPDDVKDEGGGVSLNAEYFIDPDVKATQLRSLTFGGVRFDDFNAFEYKDLQAMEGVSVDGDIGYDFLKYF